MFIETDRSMLPELEIYASCNEVALKRYYEPEPGLFIAETPNVILRAMDAGYEALSLLIDPQLKETAASEVIERAGDVPVYLADLDIISEISGFKQTRGVLCAMKRRKLPALEEILKASSRIAVLENIENPTNVGAIFRSAAALGFDAVVLTRRCADPLYRRAARVSMGTVFQIPWTFVGGKHEGLYGNGLKMIREAGFQTVSMALSDRAVPIDEPALKEAEKLALFFGNEENGLTEETLEASDYIVKIPMMNGVDSLNVAASSAVAFWELRKR
ncbi:MAG: RNA methyltransferase [Lachnospiraceae bacterium]|nr:RNA methyltransferase [Lachnospiraceae bacterium]